MRAPLVLLLALSPLACAGQPSGTAPAPPSKASPALPARFDAAAIDAYVAGQVQERGLVGAQLVIAREGKVVLSRSYGMASLETRAPVTDTTAFGIGSVTKQFVCAAALLLDDDGKLSLDDPVSAHYPGLTRAADIRLDDLGSHQSGYPDYYPLDYVDRRMHEPIDPDALIRRYATVPLEFEPRTRFSYSNTGFVVLGRVVEKVSGVPLGQFLRRRIFAPLGMTRSFFDPPPGTAGLAAGHLSFALGEPKPVRPEADGWLHAAAGIYATASDLVRWDLALSQGKLLSRKALARFTSARATTGGRSTDYGCGIGVRRVGGETVLSHTGAVAGFLSYNAFVPRTRSAVVFLVNTEGGSPGEIHQQLVSLLVGPTTHVPAVSGPPATEAALELLRQMQRGEMDRSRLSPELSAYLDDARLAEAAPRLRALGQPISVAATDMRGRGGLEVTEIRFKFAERTVKALLYRAPDGVVHEFLLLRD